MSQWLVTQGDNQFTVEGLEELEQLARSGNLKAGDMIQPPGATDWMYAVEIPEIKVALGDTGGGDDDVDAYLAARRKLGGVVTLAVAAVLGLIVLGGAGVMVVMYQQLPRGDEVLLGEGGLTFSEMLVTDRGVNLLAQPDANARPVQSLDKDQALDLLAKRGSFYRARTKGGAEGWVAYDQVIPMYQLGGAEVRDEYDPLFNPDRYVEVANASWQQLPDQEADQVTVFQFMLKNKSQYAMTDLVILATIKDAKGHELERVEIPIEGVVPTERVTLVGTLKPDAKGQRDGEPSRLLTQYSFDQMAKSDPDLQLRYSVGVEVSMSTADFTQANIDILELRAVPAES